MKLSCVILTMGNRPAELDRAIASTAPLRRDGCDLVVVGNGADVPPVPDGVTTIRLPENVGVAAGRNTGVDATVGDVVLFLDDDGWYPDAAWGSTSPGVSPPIRCSPWSRSGWSIRPAVPGRGGTCRGCGPVIRSGRRR